MYVRNNEDRSEICDRGCCEGLLGRCAATWRPPRQKQQVAAVGHQIGMYVHPHAYNSYSVYIHTYKQTNTYTVHTYIYIHKLTNRLARSSPYIQFIHTCMHTYIHSLKYTYIQTHTHTVHTYIHTYIYIN